MRAPLAMLLVLVGVYSGCSGGGSSPTTTPERARYVTNGSVNAVVVAADGTTYLGGSFTSVGPATGSFVPIDTATGRPPATFPKVAGHVYAAVADGAGGWYIGGAFTYVGGAARNNIAHVLASGAVDATWNPNANNYVYALAVSGSTVYAGGNFTGIGPEPFAHFAALGE